MHKTALVFLTLTVLAGCEVCENGVSQTIKSPSGQMTAFVFDRGCGATVGFNTQISIVRGSTLPDDAGNVLILDGTVPLVVSWLSDTSLQVAGPLRSQVFKQETAAHGVRISYVRQAL